jgi:hypothetical protein
MPRFASALLPLLLLLATAGVPALLAVEPGPLPAPDRSGGVPLMQALAERQSHREFADAPLTTQQLSDLLWATAGVNRADAGKRTAPTARNWQEVDVYLTTPEGVFLYQPSEHALARIDDRDLRALAGSQDFVATAPLNLVFVADTARMVNCPADRFDFYAGADTAFMAQNAYLYCASADLRCVVRALIDREAFHAALGLTASQRVTLAMTVGMAPAGE